MPAQRWPSPLRRIAYRGAIGSLVQALAPNTEADPAALLFNSYAMFGNLIGRSAYFRAEADFHYSNLFVGLVGDTAKGRKGVSRQLSRQVFAVIDPEWAANCSESGLSTGEGLVWRVRDAIERNQPIKDRGKVLGYELVTEDPGITDKRLLVEETEFATTLKVMGRQHSTLSPTIRNAWDGLDLRITTKNSPAKATAPHITLITHITRDELRRYLDVTETANGFGNRFLWVCVRRARQLPDGGKAIDLAPYVREMKAVIDHAKQVRELRRDSEAADYWRTIYGPLSDGRPGMLGAMTGRAEAQVMRLACLTALSDMSYIVTLDHLKGALEMWRYCFDSAKYLFGDRLGDPVADEILHVLIEAWPESVTRSDITRKHLARNRSASETSRGFSLLLDCGLAGFELDKSGEGRPVERWFAHKQDDDKNDLYDRTQDRPDGSVVNVVNVVGEHAQEDADGVF